MTIRFFQDLHKDQDQYRGAYLDQLAQLHESCGFSGWSRQAIAEMLNDANVDCLLLFDTSIQTFEFEDKINGFILFRRIAEEGEILTFGVVAHKRRRGLALQMLEALLIWQEAQVDCWHLEVSESNLAARRLYEKSYFKEVGRRQNYYSGNSNNNDAILMKYTRLSG